jgi:hypothetical protein
MSNSTPLKIEKKTIPTFVCNKPIDANLFEPNIHLLITLWKKCSLALQCQFLNEIAKTLKDAILSDYKNNISTNKINGLDSNYIENLNLESYGNGREPRLLCFILGLIGKSVSNLGESLPQVVLTLESIYKLTTGSILPFTFSINVFLYKKFNSQQLIDILGSINGPPRKIS